MEVVVKKLTKEESIVEVETKTKVKTLTIRKTPHGHSYNDFTEWDITDSQYYRLEDFVDEIIRKMEGTEELEVRFDL